MKVLCINDEGWVENRRFLWLWHREKEATGPGYGDINTVTGEYYNEGKLWYELLEWPDDGYEADCFIPLSDICEEELAKERPNSKTYTNE